MSDNYDDKDLEKIIFRDGLTSAEIEPSEKFWNRAYEDILQRENITNANQKSKWRGAFYIMSALVLLLGSYAVYMHSEVSDIKHRLGQLGNTHITIVQHDTIRTIVTRTIEVASVNSTLPSINRNTGFNARNGMSNVASLNKTTSSNTFSIEASGGTKNITANTSEDRPSNSMAPGVSTPPTSNSVTSETVSNNSSSSADKGSLEENPGNSRAIAGAINNSVQQPGNTPLRNNNSIQSSTPPVAKSTISNKKADSAIKVAVLDSINSSFVPKKPITLKGILSNISVSAFYAPGITDDFLSDKENDPTHAITANYLKTHQDGDGSLVLGLRVAYDISDKCSIFSGCYYSSYSYNINPNVIYAQQQEDGQVGYSVTTSSGTVFLPYFASPTHVGDSIKVKGTSSRSYLSIPLQAKYNFIAGRRLSFYATAGFSINIANYVETQIHWENTSLQEGDFSVPSIYGLTTVHYTYNVGLGINYLVLRGLSLYAEPFVDGSLTSINNNTPVITYPLSLGVALGITYHF